MTGLRRASWRIYRRGQHLRNPSFKSNPMSRLRPVPPALALPQRRSEPMRTNASPLPAPLMT